MAASLFFFISIVGASAFHDVTARGVDDLKPKQLSSLVSSNQLIVLTTPDCVACKRQLSDLKCLNPKTNVNVVSIDTKITAARLKASKLKKQFDFYTMSRHSLSRAGLEHAAMPTTLYLNNNKVRQLPGYQNCQKLKRAIEAR